MAQRDGRQRILLRITPGIEAHTHEYIQTGQEDTKFGFGLVQGLAIEAIKRARPRRIWSSSACTRTSAARSSSSTRTGPPSVCIAICGRPPTELGFACRYLNVGGGLGVRYTRPGRPGSIDEYAEVEVTGRAGGDGSRGPAGAAHSGRARPVDRGHGGA